MQTEETDLLGILTLENVIERILNMDIHDEKDHERHLRHEHTKQI